MEKNVTDFSRLVKDINDRKILIPDFQRDFVWKEEERQRNIVASVLAKMPIGSILLLTSDPNDYQCKFIGTKDAVKSDDLSNVHEADFLLDGQQRITVLTNVFSDVIHDNCKNMNDYVSPTLKRRFFLRLPKWKSVYIEKDADLFNVRTLDFPQNYNGDDYPEFLSGDIAGSVEVLTFTKDKELPFKPGVTLDTKLDNFCVGYETGYLVPLYLLINPHRKNAIDVRLRDVLKAIADDIGKNIKAHLSDLPDIDAQFAFIDEIIEDEEERNDIKKDEAKLLSKFEEKLKYKQDRWREQFKEYLDSCLRYLSLNQIQVSASHRARAIDIYENLNRGGVSLSTFDLIMARVAKCNPKSLSERIKEEIKQTVTYDTTLLPDEILGVFINETKDKNYKASVRMKCYNEQKNELHTKYLDAFLDVLCLYCNNPDGNPAKYDIRYIKKNDILALKPEQIDKNCEKIVNALDRAMFFFQARCGLRNIAEFNYNLVLVLVATIFTNDDNFNSKKVHGLLEAWYWTVLFAGEFDQDQNQTMIKHLKLISGMINKTQDEKWLKSAVEYVLKKTNYSDEKLLLMEKAADGRTPKKILRMFICQYMLAGTYLDMFDEKVRVSVYSDVAYSLEAHHIVPLGSIKKYGEMTSAMRNDESNICNSPLNFALITKKSNDAISSDSLADYLKKVSKSAASLLHIPNLESTDINDAERVKSVLKTRYEYLFGQIRDHILKLTDAWSSV